jgi:hypothetical protein
MYYFWRLDLTTRSAKASMSKARNSSGSTADALVLGLLASAPSSAAAVGTCAGPSAALGLVVVEDLRHGVGGAMQDAGYGLSRTLLLKLSEKPHERAKRLTIRRLIATLMNPSLTHIPGTS